MFTPIHTERGLERFGDGSGLSSSGNRLRGGRATRAGFTMVELMVSAVIVVLVMLLLVSMVGTTSSVWTRSRSQVEQFQQAREAFDALTRAVSEATLNTYYDYEDAGGNIRTPANSRAFVPARYVRQSELRFLCGPDLVEGREMSGHSIFFQAPKGFRTVESTGLENLLNTVGFFVELGDDAAFLPSMLAGTHSRRRFRLFQLVESSERLSIYHYTGGNSTYAGQEWFEEALASGEEVSIVAENILCVIFLPKLSMEDQGGAYTDASLAPNYRYDSTTARSDPLINPKNQLPPIVQVTMVAIDELSAKRMSDGEQDELKTLIDGLFRSVGSTTDPSVSGYARDLQTLESALISRRINYRIFSSNVAIKAAKWSREQKN